MHSQVYTYILIQIYSGDSGRRLHRYDTQTPRILLKKRLSNVYINTYIYA
jgi:hypothetical protein